MEVLEITLGQVFISEMVGSALLLLLGGGVVANTLLKGSKGQGTGWLLINWGWGLAVFAGVLASGASGAHINPAVTVGIIVRNTILGDPDFVAGAIPISIVSTLVYFAAQLVGAMIGAGLVYLTYKKHFDAEENPGFKLGIFATGPEIRSYGWNVVTEIIGTFVLVFVIFASGTYAGTQAEGGAVNLGWLGALGVALLVVSIGASLGGPTGYAINPTRDLGPRIMHALLPIKGKGTSDWGYAWVPIVGPLIGGALGGLASTFLLIAA